MNEPIKCSLCPKGCVLSPGKTGDCGVRKHIDGSIRCTTYGFPCALNIDPVEKKPLYHFLPGTPIFSIATAGCNLHCAQCQNWSISQSGRSSASSGTLTPQRLAQLAIEQGCPAIAYTYTEPLVSYEYTYDCCRAAAQCGIKNVLVTAAFINPEPLRNICCCVDAANVDLKSFSDDFYRTVCDGRLQPVLTALKTMKACGVMLELTNLLIPTMNDSEEETRQLCSWVAENLGPETPLHFSRFFPQNLLMHLPPTPEETIRRAREIGMECGLLHVYVGNMADGEGEATRCAGCSALLLRRSGYHLLENRLKEGCCPDCGKRLYGIFERGG